MDRLTALSLLLVLGVAFLAVVYVANQAVHSPAKGPNSIILKPGELTTTHWTFRVNLDEGVGPNSGKPIEGNVTAYFSKTPITDPYNVPDDAVAKATESTTNGVATFQLTVDKLYMTQNGLPVYFVATSDGHYAKVAKDVIPPKATASQMDNGDNLTIQLDKVATMGWTADDAFRGTDSPVLRYKSSAELYKTIFEIKPQVDFDTGKPSGVFIVKKVYLEKEANADLSNVDHIDATIGSVQFDDVTPSDLPKIKTFDNNSYVTVTADKPMNVEIDVYTKDGTASLTSGQALLDVKLVDVINNTYTVPIKVA